MRIKLLGVFLLVAMLAPGFASALGKRPQSLQRISPVYFELSRDFAQDESRLHTKNGRTFAGPKFCKGRYVAYYKDKEGTYFAPPDGCDAPLVLGVWVPDDPDKHGYDTWLIIKKVTLKCPNAPGESCGLLINWLANLEVGNFVKSGYRIEGEELLREFAVINALPQPSP
ncbi:MAG: hypothetical protein ACOY82_14395 [Pseudomonadota bacterium]